MMTVTAWQPRSFKSSSHIRFCLECNPGPVEHSVSALFNNCLTLKNGCCIVFQWEDGEGDLEQ